MAQPRSYRQNCSLAYVLDLVGERWTLLIIRELARGPKRFTDLEAGLHGIGANLLATRLKRLEALALIHRAATAPGGSGYGLTDTGETLAAAMEDLVVLGFTLLDAPDTEYETRAAWAAMGMRIAMDRDPQPPPDGTYAFHVDQERFWLRTDTPRSQLRDGDPPYPADATVRLTLEQFFALATGHGRLHELNADTAGDAERLAQLFQTFRLPLESSATVSPR